MNATIFYFFRSIQSHVFFSSLVKKLWPQKCFDGTLIYGKRDMSEFDGRFLASRTKLLNYFWTFDIKKHKSKKSKVFQKLVWKVAVHYRNRRVFFCLCRSWLCFNQIKSKIIRIQKTVAVLIQRKLTFLFSYSLTELCSYYDTKI